jgi:hypothetical protein
MIFPETDIDISEYALESLLSDELSDDALVDVLKTVCERYKDKKMEELRREKAEHDANHGSLCRCANPMTIFHIQAREGCPMEHYAHELLIANGRDGALKLMLGQNPPSFYERIKPELIAKYDSAEVASYVYSDNYLMQFDRHGSSLEKFYKMCKSEGATKCVDALKKRFRTLTSRYERQMVAAQ